MEEVNMNNTSQDNNSSFTYDYGNYYEQVEFIMKVVTIIIICIGLPLTLVAIYAVRSLVKDDHVVPIYVINLLITDLIQLCCMITWVLPKNRMFFWTASILFFIYLYCLVASIGFMVCIALERYLVIACPLWYSFRRTIKVSVLVCVVVWALPAVIYCLLFTVRNSETIGGILLLPLPLFIFFLGGTLKALSASISVHSDEKRRIVGMLVLVLLIYTLLFLPSIILLLAERSSGIEQHKLINLSLTFLKFSPLADLFLYIFMRKGTIDKLLASVCCCRMDSDDISSPV